jgi:hypothetical protein
MSSSVRTTATRLPEEVRQSLACLAGARDRLRRAVDAVFAILDGRVQRD